jgi:hypothetical protein
MFQDKPWVVRVVFVLCVLGLAATFPYFKTTVKLDSLDHCSVTFDSSMQVAYISVDVSLLLFYPLCSCVYFNICIKGLH